MATYQDTVEWMFKQLPMYQRQGKSAYKPDLSNSIKLAKHLKYPERKIKTIHVAGTNGKGSTCHMLASILQEAGYKTGLFTSPHLKDFRERIRIDGKMVSKQFVTGFVTRNKQFFESNQLSFFEMTSGMAFDYFYKKQVDVAIIEVGMGGRLDSTNIIRPQVSVITNIGLDHTQFLGDSLEMIAKEKAGIIKERVPVIIGETQIETEPIFREVADNLNSEIFFADQSDSHDFESDLIGIYQKKNIQSVVQTIKTLKSRGFAVSESHIKKGLLHVRQNTGLRGRWDVIQDSPIVICDTAHNREGLTQTMNQLKNLTFERLHIIFGVVNDKDLSGLFSILPRNAEYYFCKPDIPRGLNSHDLMSIFESNGFLGKAYSSVNQALDAALKKANKNDVIYAGGSTFVVAEII